MEQARSEGVRSGGSSSGFITLVFFTTFSCVTPAWGYRPFVSTDAAIVDPREVEVELGYFNLERVDEENTFITPKVVLNWGLMRNLEVVGEFEVEKAPNESAQVVDPALFLKVVLKEGVLQGEDGMSLAVEAGPLLPATVAGERKVGFEGIGIMSGRCTEFTYHVNFGGGVNRAQADPFAVWGVIVEFPILQNVRLVGEVNGENGEGEHADNSLALSGSRLGQNFSLIWGSEEALAVPRLTGNSQLG
jgi:hypothetical protein